MGIRIFLVSAILLVLAANARANDSSWTATGDLEGKRPVVGAVRIPRKAAPKLDGVPDEAVWSRATPVTNLHQLTPDYRSPSTERTEIFVVHDRDHLYIAARMYMDDPSKLMARSLIPGSTRSDDTFEITLAPFDNHRSGYFFTINPNSVRTDALFEGVNRKNWNWDAIWYATAKPADYGWSVEVAIPFKSLNFDPDMENWGISFGRDHARIREDSAWTSYQQRISLDALGELRGVKRIRQGLGLIAVS